MKLHVTLRLHNGELRLEQEAKNAQLKKEREEQAALNKPIGGAAPTLPTLGTTEQGQWYFYNSSVMNTGQQEFFSQRKWGRRENEDFWRIAAKEKLKTPGTAPDGQAKKDSTQQAKGEDGKQASESVDLEKPKVSEDRAAWVKDIPYTAAETEKSNEKIMEAYRNLGDIYAVKILDHKEAVKSYQTLLSRFPKTTYEPEVLYHLYKSYTELKETSKANQAKEELIKKYPESKYALILQNKPIQTAETSSNKELVKTYEHLYELYVAGDYKAVKEGKKEADKKFSGNAMQAKFDLLYALAVGKTDSLGAFKIELQDIVKAYPKTDVAERAQAILTLILNPGARAKADSAENAPEFALNPEVAHYYVFASKAEKLDMNELLQKIINYNDEYHQLDALRANTLLSSDGYQLLYVREFPKLENAVKYLDGLNLTTFYKAYLPANTAFYHFAIPVDTFKKMMKEKKVEAYNKFFAEQLPTLLKQIKP